MKELNLPHVHENEDKMRQLHRVMSNTDSFAAVADIFKQLSDPNRVRIFWLLCHCRQCVVNLAAMVDMSSPAISHHLRQLKDSGLIVSQREGKEVYYMAADTPQAQLLHTMIEKNMELTCPRDSYDAVSEAPHMLDPDRELDEGGCTQEQLDIIRQVHERLTTDLECRVTIEELSRQFPMNPSTMKSLFKAVYGNSIAAHIREHRMERAAQLLLESRDSVAAIARAVGYESQSKFSAEFRKSFGLLPTEFRKKHNHG